MAVAGPPDLSSLTRLGGPSRAINEGSVDFLMTPVLSPIFVIPYAVFVRIRVAQLGGTLRG